jgi:hypothetical protein
MKNSIITLVLAATIQATTTNADPYQEKWSIATPVCSVLPTEFQKDCFSRVSGGQFDPTAVLPIVQQAVPTNVVTKAPPFPTGATAPSAPPPITQNGQVIYTSYDAQLVTITSSGAVPVVTFTVITSIWTTICPSVNMTAMTPPTAPLAPPAAWSLTSAPAQSLPSLTASAPPNNNQQAANGTTAAPVQVPSGLAGKNAVGAWGLVAGLVMALL